MKKSGAMDEIRCEILSVFFQMLSGKLPDIVLGDEKSARRANLTRALLWQLLEDELGGFAMFKGMSYDFSDLSPLEKVGPSSNHLERVASFSVPFAKLPKPIRLEIKLRGSRSQDGVDLGVVCWRADIVTFHPTEDQEKHFATFSKEYRL